MQHLIISLLSSHESLSKICGATATGLILKQKGVSKTASQIILSINVYIKVPFLWNPCNLLFFYWIFKVQEIFISVFFLQIMCCLNFQISIKIYVLGEVIAPDFVLAWSILLSLYIYIALLEQTSGQTAAAKQDLFKWTWLE